MTNTNYPRAAFLGFGRIFNELEQVHSKANNSGYPPHNVIEETDTKFIIEIAVAGFDSADLDIEVKDGFLNITGGKNEADDRIKYVHKGISSRKFSRTFRLAEHVEVNGASLNNGILVINLEHNVPDEKRPQKISIDRGHTDAELLTEG